MHKYLIKFKKLGLIRYTSHLDLIRIFHRAFKRKNIMLSYSQGFNPHPKMSFAQPLSLGFASIGEYLEFETTVPYGTKEIADLLNSTLPDGIENCVGCRPLDSTAKSVSASVNWAIYEIICNEKFNTPIEDHIARFLSQEEITALKRQKKKRELKEIDIKHMIDEFNALINDGDLTIFTAKLKTGSYGNLNPELLIKSLCKFSNLLYKTENYIYKRIDLLDEENNSLLLT